MVRLLIISVAVFFSAQVMAADCGRFKVVKGKVEYKAKGKKSFKKARKNRPVCQGATVRTGKNGRAKIEMADKNEINISPGTEMVVEIYQPGKKAVLNVLNGKVRSDVKNKYKDDKTSHYRVKTKSAVAGVRGTEFLASYNARTNQARVVTFEGEVAVGQMSGDSFVPKVTVKPGQYTSNSPGTDPHPAKEVPPAELAQMDRESKVSNSGGGDKAPASTNQQKDDKEKEEPKEEAPKQQGPNDEAKDEPKEEPKPQPQQDAKNEGEGAPGPDGEGPPPEGIAENGDGSDGTVGNGNPGEPGPSGIAGEPGGDDTFREDEQFGDPDFDPAQGENGESIDGSRDVASIEVGDDMGLPPPTLEDMPSTDDMGFIDPPTPTMFDPFLPDLPDCQQCNDAIINQKVRVIIRPILPGTATP